MSWFRIDDKSAFHRKVLRAGNEAWGAFARAGAASSGEGTDGRVTLDTCLAIAPKKVWDKLVDSGLMERIEGSTDLLLHDYLEWNPSSAEVAASIDAKRRAGSMGGRSKATRHSNGLAAATAPASSSLAPARADATAGALAESKQSPSIIPTHPNPSISDPPVGPPQLEPAVTTDSPQAAPTEHAKTKASRKKPATAAPSSDENPFDVGEWLTRWKLPRLTDEREGPEVAKFLDHHRAKGSTFADWTAAWRTWQRNAVEFAKGRNGNGAYRPVQPPAPQSQSMSLEEWYAKNPPTGDPI